MSGKMKILFSPIGGTDINEMEKAAIFRIQNFVKPELTYIYCSQSEFYNKQTKQKEELIPSAEGFAELLKNETNVDNELIVDRELSEPDNYDLVLTTFERELAKISEKHPEHELHLNAGSATPAMKAALMVLNELKIYNSHAYQAPDPKFSTDDVREILNHSLRSKLFSNNIRTLINNFDYSGAVSLIESENIDIPEAAKKLTYGAKYALILDHQKALENFSGTDYTYDQNKPLPQYLNMLQVKIWRDEFGDFARAFSPAITEALNLMLENAGVNRDDFSKLENTVSSSSKKSRILDVEKVNENDVFKKAFEDVLEKQKINDPPKPYFYNSHLKNLLDEISDSEQDKTLAKKLLKFEKDIRNLAAHEMIKIDENRIIRGTDIKPRDLLTEMASIARTDLDYYEKINEEIFSYL